MTEEEYNATGCRTYVSEYVLKTGKRTYGIIDTVFEIEEPGVFYFIHINNYFDYRACTDDADWDEKRIRAMARKFELEWVEECHRIM